MPQRERMVELGCYGLAGHVDDPRMLLDEVRDAERTITDIMGIPRITMAQMDVKASLEQLEHIATLIPDDWLPAAVGAVSHCAARVLDQLAAGADGVILHGSSPGELEPVVEAYRQVRPPGRFEEGSANPAR